MTKEQHEQATAQLGMCGTIGAILESAHGQEALKSPGFLECMQEQARHLGEVLPEQFRTLTPETK